MPAHPAQDIARDIVVAWLSHAGPAASTFDHAGEKVGEFLGKLFKKVVRAVADSKKIATSAPPRL